MICALQLDLLSKTSPDSWIHAFSYCSNSQDSWHDFLPEMEGCITMKEPLEHSLLFSTLFHQTLDSTKYSNSNTWVAWLHVALGLFKYVGTWSGVTDMYGAGTDVERRYLISSWIGCHLDSPQNFHDDACTKSNPVT